MLKSHERFYTENGKRRILVVDDEMINQEILGAILEVDYDVMRAFNGREALEIIRDNAANISLILLDLMMPVMSGTELLSILKEEPEFRRIPVIVLTSDKSAEVKSLQQGASDFIVKPYDMPEVILARVQRTIELAEDTLIIQTTERDELTGLLNREFFFRYAEQYDTHHPNDVMDAVNIDINHFHVVNELHGRIYGDMILRRMGEQILEIIERTGGIGGRKDADMFLLYLPHGADYGEIHSRILAALGEDKIRLRIGVYSEVDRTLEMERRFDRAKIAGDGLRSTYGKSIAFYDSSLHDKEMMKERLLDEMDQALEEGQFMVYFQPKVDIKGSKPVLHSAEALIRWKHPVLGMISPGVFVPLFEKNGMIQKIDRFAWREVARQIRRWRDLYGVTIPVSVNVSRVDMYDTVLLEYLKNLMVEHDIKPEDYHLEITESVYTENADQIIAMVEELREQGFCVEMDDFGSGYSSLNMLANLPIDVLKMDMQFLRNLQAGGKVSEKNKRMMELVIDIADFLGVPVVAEGVETEEQLQLLKEMGCDMIQGYYFSRPVPAEEFDKFIIERMRYDADNG